MASESGDGSLASVLEFWRAFDLDGRRLELDKQGLEMQDAKDASAAARKRLAEFTKDFRRAPDGDKLTSIKDLLRAYQEEIDTLTKRARFSDNAFFSLYKALYTAPDPVNALERVSNERQRAAAAEVELRRLRSELVDYEREFSNLKNQDITIRRLEETIAEYEAGAQATLSEAVAARQRELEAAAAARIQEGLEREAVLEKRLQAVSDGLAESTAAADRAQTQLLEASLALQEREAAWHAERDLLAESADRTAATAAAAERRCQQLRLEADRRAVATGPMGSSSFGGGGGSGGERWQQVSALEAELSEATALNARIQDDATARERAWGQQRAALEEAARRLQAGLDAQTAAAAALQQQLAQRPGKEEVEVLRRQLRLLEQLEYNVVDDEGDGLDGGAGGGGGGGGAGSRAGGADGAGRGTSGSPIRPAEELQTTAPEDTAGHAERTMEQVIRGRIRRLEAEVTVARRDVAEARADADRCRGALTCANELAEQRLQMINRLEDDLARQCGAGGGGSGKGGGKSGGGSGNGGGEALSLTELLGLEALAAAAGTPAGGGVAGGNDNIDMLQIVQAQRDRFRRRISDLEAERGAAVAAADVATAASEQLRRDNLQLYEKVRFLQSYQQAAQARNTSWPASAQRMEDGSAGGGGGIPYIGRGGPSSGGRGGAAGDLSGSSSGGGGGASSSSLPAEARYGQLYENRLNPFTQFSQREQQRKYAELSIAERMTLNATRLFLSNRASRTFVCFYIVAMHAIVFLTTWHWSHSGVQACAAVAAAVAADGTRRGGGGAVGDAPVMFAGGQQLSRRLLDAAIAAVAAAAPTPEG